MADGYEVIQDRDRKLRIRLLDGDGHPIAVSGAFEHMSALAAAIAALTKKPYAAAA
jgi:hypothetical protein